MYARLARGRAPRALLRGERDARAGVGAVALAHARRRVRVPHGQETAADDHRVASLKSERESVCVCVLSVTLLMLVEVELFCLLLYVYVVLYSYYTCIETPKAAKGGFHESHGAHKVVLSLRNNDISKNTLYRLILHLRGSLRRARWGPGPHTRRRREPQKCRCAPFPRFRRPCF